MSGQKRYGLVLAGGGGKGGYEIGVWKALRESKTLKVGAVSGTSVGALNAALYAAGDYDTAEKIWMNISKNQILTRDPELIKKALSGFCMPSGVNAMASSMALVKKIGKLGAEVLIEKYSQSRGLGLFSREGLKEIIEASGVLRKLSKDSIPCFATCYNVTHFHKQAFELNRLGPDKITQILLASSAIPVIFPEEEIDGCAYYDGGLPLVGENVPVTPLYEKGYRDFIVVHLGRDGVETFTNKFGGAKFIHVFPKRSQGGFWDGTLDFDPESARKRIEAGYNDMKEQIRLLNEVDSLLSEKNEKAKEIHYYAGKYYDSLNAIFESCALEMENTSLLESKEFPFTDMDREHRKIESRMRGNKKAMHKFVLTGVTRMSAMEAQMNALHGAAGLKKLWNGISGKNRRLQKDIDQNQIQTQKATLEAISNLIEADMMGTELIRAVQCQLQGATMRMGQILEQHGCEISGIKNDYREILQKYNELVLRDTETVEALHCLYEMFDEKESAANRRIASLEERVGKVEDVQRLQNWRLNIKYQSFRKQDYKDLGLEEKIICVASDFFSLTGGEWDDDLLLFVKSALDGLEIDPYELISYGDLVYRLIEDENLRDYLFKANGVEFSYSCEPEDVVPHYEVVMYGVYLGEKAKEEEIDIKKWAADFMEDNGMYHVATAFDMVCELLVILLQFRTLRRKDDYLPSCRDMRKRALLGDTDAECRYAQKLLESGYREKAFSMVSEMEERISGNPLFDDLKKSVVSSYAASI